MRIRKNASKILGSAANPNWPSTPTTAAGVEDEGFVVCELNCSPWDLMATNPNSYCNFLTNLKEEEDEDILGNSMKTEEPEPISAIITSTVAEMTLKEIKEKKVIKRKRISKGKETIITYCKKTDGKGWHCKRPTKHPNSLCSYHLAQVRAYTSNYRSTDSSTTAADSNHNKKAVVEELATGTDSSFYYYYEGFGPCRGKRRGRLISGGGSRNAFVKEDSSSRSKECSILDNVDHGADDDDNAIAGDDEYGLDHFEEGDDDDNDHNTRYKEQNEVEKKRVVKKRGRKPFKCRSLKSLL